jgi:hypothetical protein
MTWPGSGRPISASTFFATSISASRSTPVS